MWVDLAIVIILTLLSGTFAGLTLALFGIKLSTLERKIKLGDPQAEKVYRIRKNGNLLLCTLLLGNVASYTIMAIFLGSITSGVIAGFRGHFPHICIWRDPAPGRFSKVCVGNRSQIVLAGVDVHDPYVSHCCPHCLGFG